MLNTYQQNWFSCHSKNDEKERAYIGSDIRVCVCMFIHSIVASTRGAAADVLQIALFMHVHREAKVVSFLINHCSNMRPTLKVLQRAVHSGSIVMSSRLYAN